jgi:hypothetical protein
MGRVQGEGQERGKAALMSIASTYLKESVESFII